eukprot:GHVH01003661.1.p1 GENE.GHVH01003661.1~~GHVH01003661.1.p1  ORF type:complete len:493 (+),score=76.46 GHVH01003661.1:279-1757(+)
MIGNPEDRTPSGNSKVKELVERFERWERQENVKKNLSRGTSVEIGLDGLPPATPRGQVRRLRDQLEAKTKIQESSTLIPAKKNDNLRRLKTSFYEQKIVDKSFADEVGDEICSADPADVDDNHEPYVHVDAYWDEATQAYWYQSEDRRWLVYDDITQMFVDPAQTNKSLHLPDQVAASVNNPTTPPSQPTSPLHDLMPNGAGDHSPQESRVTPRESTLTSGKSQFGGLSRPVSNKPVKFPASPKQDDDEDNSDLQEAKSLPSDERISVATLTALNSALGEVSLNVGVPLHILRKFHLGVQLYALVKSNGGMLKPIIIHLAVDRGKIFIVRQGRSRFLTIRHFAECDYSPSCIDFMAKDSSRTTGGMRQTIQGLRQQPLVVLWTSTHFARKPSSPPADKKDCGEGGSKGMAFVFDNRNLRSEFILVLKAMVQYWLLPKDIDFVFKEKDGVPPEKLLPLKGPPPPFENEEDNEVLNKDSEGHEEPLGDVAGDAH